MAGISTAGSGSLERRIRALAASVAEIGAAPQDSEEIRLQKQLLVAGSLMIALAALAWGLVYIYFAEAVVGVISLLYAALAGASVALGLPRRYHLYRFVQFSMGLLVPFVDTLLLGGWANSSGVILWSSIIPLGSLILSEPGDSIFWWIAYSVLLALSGILDPYVKHPNHLPIVLINAVYVMNALAVTGIAFVVIKSFIRQKDTILHLLRVEEQKSEGLLLNILPREIATILKNEQRTIAEHFGCASILFADLVGFTPLTARLAPVEMVNLLNEIFSHFDDLVEKHGLEKIRTIGDNYMVASGAPRRRPDHAQALAELALEMSAYLHARPSRPDRAIQFRIGINSGPVVGGVIGRKKFVYDLWGDAVNIASRMESQGLPGRIQITQSTYEIIRDQFLCEPRGPILVKGKGEMNTWFLVRKKG
jgi:adenylate cyclase